MFLIFVVIFRITTVTRVIKTKDDITFFLLRHECSETEIKSEIKCIRFKHV